MALLAWVLGILGGLCAVMGIITATEAIALLGDELTWMFWFGLAGILLISCIAAAVGSRGYE